jgi:hypothetical protein
VVEHFLLARDRRDPWGAAVWCDPLLELQDVDGSWFIDTPTTSDWLRQLTDRYFVERLSALAIEGNAVSWTERLSQRSLPYHEALRSSFTIEVHAVIRDGRIAYLSGPYPPIPLRRPTAAAGEPVDEVSGGTMGIAPGTMVIGSALALSLTVLLTAHGSQVLRVAVQLWLHRRESRVRKRDPHIATQSRQTVQ